MEALKVKPYVRLELNLLEWHRLPVLLIFSITCETLFEPQRGIFTVPFGPADSIRINTFRKWR